jgi:hypothetical protein
LSRASRDSLNISKRAAAAGLHPRVKVRPFLSLPCDDTAEKVVPSGSWDAQSCCSAPPAAIRFKAHCPIENEGWNANREVAEQGKGSIDLPKV